MIITYLTHFEDIAAPPCETAMFQQSHKFNITDYSTEVLLFWKEIYADLLP